MGERPANGWTGSAINISADVFVRHALGSLLADEIPLREFQAWFAPVAWGLGSTSANPLTRRVELRLAEFTSGDWTEAELRLRLAEEMFGKRAHIGSGGER
jgi:hypothetical protein